MRGTRSLVAKLILPLKQEVIHMNESSSGSSSSSSSCSSEGGVKIGNDELEGEPDSERRFAQGLLELYANPDVHPGRSLVCVCLCVCVCVCALTHACNCMCLLQNCFAGARNRFKFSIDTAHIDHVCIQIFTA